MDLKILSWFSLASVITIGLCGFGLYLTLLIFILSFIIGVLTIFYFNYHPKKIFATDIDRLNDPLQEENYSIHLPKVLEEFEKPKKRTKFDNRITGSEAVDSFLNEIITIIINDYVTSWYEIVTDDDEMTTHAIKKLVLSGGANVANRVKCVDWIHLLSTKFPELLTTHLKLFKQCRVRLKHINVISAKELANGCPKSKGADEKRMHRRNKSETDLLWPPDSQTFGKSKFYGSNEEIVEKSLTDLFFDLECTYENREICRDIYCVDSEREYALLCEVSETVLYLVAPEEAWKCHSMKMLLVELLAAVVLRPLFEMLSDPDNINRAILKYCCKESSLPSDIFLLVVRCSYDAEELDATMELVQKDIQKLHSKDSAGEWELQDRQKLSSLQYLSRILQARRATLGPQEGLSNNANTDKISEEVARSLKFLRATTSWRSNAQYLLEIELNEADATHTSNAVIDNLRSSALELCDMYLASNRPTVMGLPENCFADLVRKITTEGEEFTNNPVICFDEVQKCVCDALEDDPSWQADFMMDNDNSNAEIRRDERNETKKYDKCKRLVKNCLNRIPKMFHKNRCKDLKCDVPYKSNTFPRVLLNKENQTVKNHTLPKRSVNIGDMLHIPGRHNRSRSDIVGNNSLKINEYSGPSNNSTVRNNSLSLSHTNISQNTKNHFTPLSACIIETALVQDKGKTFGIYAIAVSRLSDNEEWHIYRRYSDFYDLHCAIKDKWPELSTLPFPAKKTFSNTSRSVLESRKRMLNKYLQTLAGIAREARYQALWGGGLLGGLLSAQAPGGKQANTIDGLLVNSLKAGMRTLKNMPDQFANTVDGMMDGISKVFQSKGGDSNYDGMKSGNSSDGQDDGEESVPLRLLEEVLGIRGLWLRRRLLAPLRTLIGDRVNRKVLELVSSLTSPRNVVQYLKTFKSWLTYKNNASYCSRDAATRARTRVAAKVALLSACSDDLRHIVGTDTARRGLLTLFDMFQTREINRRLVFVLLESILINLFPENNIQAMFRKIYSNSPRVPATKKSVNI